MTYLFMPWLLLIWLAPLSSSSLGTWSSAVATGSWRRSCGPYITGTTRPRTAPPSPLAATLAATPYGGETDDSLPLAGPPSILLTPFLQTRFGFLFILWCTWIYRSRGCIQRETWCMETLYDGVDYYNLTLCRLQSRLQNIYHGQSYARVDLNPMPESTLSPGQGQRILPLLTSLTPPPPYFHVLSPPTLLPVEG